MTSGPITSWKVDGKTMETMIDFIFLGSKITVDSDYSHEIKRRLLLGRKAMTNLDRVLRSRDITLPAKIHIVKAMVLPVIMYRCESWTIKKAKHWRTDGFKLWFWIRLLKVPCTAKRSSQSILKEINPEYSLEGLMLKLNEAPVLWPTDANSQLIGKDPDTRKDWWQEEKGTTEDEIVGWHHWHKNMSFSKLWKMMNHREAWYAAVHGVAKSQTWLSNWATTKSFKT